MRKFYLSLKLLFFTSIYLNAQTVTDLFQHTARLTADYHAIASEYQSLKLNTDRLTNLKQQLPAILKIVLPFENSLLKLDLKKVEITTDNFSVIEALPDGTRRTIAYEKGDFYQGTIEGHDRSFATIAIFDNQVMGIMGDAQSNIVLGAIEQNGIATSEYTLYRDNNLRIPNTATCGTSEIPVTEASAGQPVNGAGRTEQTGEPIEVYFECDYRFYLDKGSNSTTVINYVLSFFNSTALIYANEDVKVQVSQILVWTTQDPEAAANLNTTGTVLPAFRTRMTSTTYIGDFAHFLSTRSLGGGIAYLLGNPCGTNSNVAVSAINNTYNDFPTYSWTVMVVTHELGHNLGSNHTQWCGWVGGAIDNCYTTEGGCPAGPAPINGGTIMSYCHLTSSGINLSNGFGIQPGNRIRTVIGAATCYGDCRMTISLAKIDASCGQNNGFATVSATNGTGSITYTWSNGQTGTNLSNVGPGTYHVTVHDGANCQVMGVVTIVNSGPTLNATLTPGGPTSFCTGGSILLNVTNNIAYTYQWYRNAVLIPSATSNTYSATTAGNYSVLASSGPCSVTRSVQITEVAIPTATIIPGGPTSFCSGGSVILNGNAGGSYSYQWYNNAVAITGATSPTYTATASGTYHVKVFAGSCESVSPTVSVTVNPLPQANITAVGATTFCTGGSVTLNASTGTGYTYQWYNNALPISGATNSTYTASASGNYTVKVTANSCETISSATTVTLITTPTANVSAGSATTFCTGGSVTLSASTGSSYSYQWYNNAVAISGATNSTYTATTTGNYSVKVSVGICDASSAPVAVTVNPLPQATVVAGGPLLFCSGSSVTLTSSTGAGYTHQWYLNGTPISGATNTAYAATTGGSYTVMVNQGACAAASPATVITVYPNPVVTVNPAASTIQKFQNQTLTASGATSYNWSAQPALVSSTATTGIVAPLTTTVYTIQGTDANGCKGSATATVTVIGCGEASAITATLLSPSRVLVKWTNPSGVTTDTLQYRKLGTAAWTKIFVTGSQYEINGLEPGARYEYNIITLCSSTTIFAASATNNFNTASLNNKVYFRLFPNPVADNSRLEVIADRPYSLQTSIYDNAGKLVMNFGQPKSYPGGQVIQPINAEKLSNGIYYVVIRINNETYSIKMLVSR